MGTSRHFLFVNLGPAPAVTTLAFLNGLIG